MMIAIGDRLPNARADELGFKYVSGIGTLFSVLVSSVCLATCLSTFPDRLRNAYRVHRARHVIDGGFLTVLHNRLLATRLADVLLMIFCLGLEFSGAEVFVASRRD